MTLLFYFAGGKQSSDGIVYRFMQNEKILLLKVFNFAGPDVEEQKRSFEARLTLIKYLQDQGVPVVSIVSSPEGNLFEAIYHAGEIWVGYVMQKLSGRSPNPNVWDPALILQWGKVVGQVHRVTQTFPAWLDANHPEIGKGLLSWQTEWASFYKMCQTEWLRSSWLHLKEHLDALDRDQNHFGFIHNDPHIWNLQRVKERVYLLDFDVANHHWCLNDIAIASQHILMLHSGGLHQPLRKPKFLKQFFSAFFEGYRQQNLLDADALVHLDDFIAYRRILLYLVMPGWRRSKPSLNQSWQEMIRKNPPIFERLELS